MAHAKNTQSKAKGLLGVDGCGGDGAHSQGLTDQEYAELLRRMVQVYGPLLDYLQAFGEHELKAPLLQDSIEELLHGLQRGLVPRGTSEKPVPGTLGGKELGGHARCLERVHHVNGLPVGDIHVVSSVQKEERWRPSDVSNR